MYTEGVVRVDPTPPRSENWLGEILCGVCQTTKSDDVEMLEFWYSLLEYGNRMTGHPTHLMM